MGPRERAVPANVEALQLTMKFFVFGLFCAIAIPTLTCLAARSATARGLLLCALVVSTALGPGASIHLTTLTDYRGTEDGFIVHLTDVLCVALAMALIVAERHRVRLVPHEPLPLAALVVVGSLSTAAAHDPTLSLCTMFTLLKACLIYWCVSSALTTGTSTRWLWRGFLTLAASLSVITVAQRVILHVPRVNALFPHSNTLPSFTFLFIPLLLTGALCEPALPRGERSFTVLSVFALSLGVMFTMSRSGFVLLPLSLIGALLTGVRHGATPSARRLGMMLLICLALMGLALSGPVMERFANAPSASGEARHEFNDAALAMADDNPLGVGLNCYADVLSTNPVYRRDLRVLRNERSAGVCHNIYLLTAAETGWVGLAIALLAAARICTVAWREGRRRRGTDAVALHALLAGWLCVLATGTLEWVMRQSPVIDMAAITTALAMVLAHRPASTVRTSSNSTLRPPLSSADRRAVTSHA
ncbi:MAG: O-antigen ligase domain-containing protein [Proteobacteria bacterium]|nr:O-antigen ligase domain-containing protein [Pseudomonadota bacterium]